MMDMAPKYMLYLVPNLRKEVFSRYDKYGDPHYRDTTLEEIRLILKDMKIDEKELLFDDEVVQLRKNLKTALIPKEHVFSGKIFFQMNIDNTADDKYIKAMITARGGIVKNKLVGHIDFIIDTEM